MKIQSSSPSLAPVRAYLHLATATSLRHRCDVAPKSNQLFWCCIVTPSDCDVAVMSLGNRFVSHSGAIKPRLVHAERKRQKMCLMYMYNFQMCTCIMFVISANFKINCEFSNLVLRVNSF